ncbi:MAG: helix-turn-helix transcriptional regulator [Rhodobacteraceae bacterium]|nr:helix-turn-helix transcriptional regulator [Paracoccaceae bacterium]
MRARAAGPARASACGFGSQQHFTTAYRQTLGTTPGAVRASMRH